MSFDIILISKLHHFLKFHNLFLLTLYTEQVLVVLWLNDIVNTFTYSNKPNQKNTRYMKRISTSLFLAVIAMNAMAQTQLTNGGFENWGNSSPGLSSEPTSWYSNQSGSNTAQLGGQTCFKDQTVVHSGTASVRVQTISGPLSTVINGNVTTGVVNAPTFTKSDGYIGTNNYSDTADHRRMPFTGRPDSLVGWYQYTQGGASEQGKVRLILHTGDYYDPETPATYHPDASANKIGDATFTTPLADVGVWTRFSVPIAYVNNNTPAYVMINVTSSANQGTTTTGSKLWLDDLQVVYKPNSVNNVPVIEDLNVYAYDNTAYADARHHAENLTISFYDVTGRVVKTATVEGGKVNSYNFSSLPAGLYVYRVSGAGAQKTGKLVIE
jgi:hypothetical protein